MLAIVSKRDTARAVLSGDVQLGLGRKTWSRYMPYSVAGVEGSSRDASIQPSSWDTTRPRLGLIVRIAQSPILDALRKQSVFCSRASPRMVSS